MTSIESRFPQLKRRRTKIVATIGPACREPEVLESLIGAGVDVFRLNLAHGEQADHGQDFVEVRRLTELVDAPVAIMADLGGPKIRVGRFPGGQIELIAGLPVTVTTRRVTGNPGLIPSQYPDLAHDVRPGDRLLLDEGNLELRVENIFQTEVTCTVIAGGTLRDNKGINLPGVALSAPALTTKDRDDARFALDLGADYLVQSFIRKAEDIEELRDLVRSEGQNTRIIAKIEKPEALEAIDAIVEAADGIMVARGDLGVELAPERVPIVQQELVHLARRKNRPVIVATQMLESMVEHPRPTRAEVSDVSSAVLSGTDAVMLSAETAAGAYPLRAVQMMDRVARQVEAWQWAMGAFRSVAQAEKEQEAPLSQRLAVARSTAQLSRDLKVRAVVVRSLNGISAAVVASTRPGAPVVATTPDRLVCRRLNLLWGVVPRLISAEEFDELKPVARRLARELDLAEEGQFILLLAGFGGHEPTITVLTV
jgi:pyruvate kinase